MAFHVLIAGGGIGGLTLAQGLRKAGISVAVHERDRTRDDRLQGYRIHISPKGCAALHECLPEELYDRFVATSGKPNTTLGFYDSDFSELLTIGDPDAPERYIDSFKSVSRISLREVLLSDLDGVVHYGKTFTRYEQLPDGRVRAHFDDGTHADGDLLVGAEGVNSRVRRQLLPEAERVDTGALSLSAKVPLDDGTRALLPGQLFAGSGFLFGPQGEAVFLAAHEFRSRSSVARAPAGGGLLLDDSADYIMWNLVTTWDKLGDRAELERMDGDGLQRVAFRALKGWSPRLHELIARSDPGSISIFPLKSSTPVGPWRSTNVTLLGDAIHNMPPTAGVGANTAILDARLLCANLIGHARGERALLDAVHAYEVEMLDYGFKAVALAMRNLRMGVSDSSARRFFTRNMFRFFNAVPPLKKQMSAAMMK
ncbi:FAD-dependent monooxygenase [Actinomadura kijaniata]|uniref:2-polyprenyl-6-methoxyphenol hydroxylase-like FAD-dependent oxidoreductase n=1 Tax=Actinomadura namibiensis TaxID=182080 RepID=A0A7W3QNE3_ACTNM|nr:NAD(P)/FAD-dependent oxidoreductase [Actinomadura namibiensis]MBA8952948.1 2-polyprenyl-6-methoxyphenol hydroxylase-like FAD-dependent oxidoreductase [Actinomadura namibiensis]